MTNHICILLHIRCRHSSVEIMQFLRKGGTSIEIYEDGAEYECNVLFLWSRKNNSVIDGAKRHATEGFEEMEAG